MSRTEIPFHLIPEGLGKQMRSRRIDLDVPMYQVAKAAKLQSTRLSSYELGKVNILSKDTDKIAFALGVSREDLIHGRFEELSQNSVHQPASFSEEGSEKIILQLEINALRENVQEVSASLLQANSALQTLQTELINSHLENDLLQAELQRVREELSVIKGPSF